MMASDKERSGKSLLSRAKARSAASGPAGSSAPTPPPDEILRRYKEAKARRDQREAAPSKRASAGATSAPSRKPADRAKRADPANAVAKRPSVGLSDRLKARWAAFRNAGTKPDRRPDHTLTAAPVAAPAPIAEAKQPRPTTPPPQTPPGQKASHAPRAAAEEPAVRPELDTRSHPSPTRPPIERREAAPVRSDDETWHPLVDPRAVFSGIGRSKAIIAATTIAGAILGVMIALSIPKTYVSTAELLVDPRDIKLSDRELTSSGLPNDATLALIENQVRLMYSQRVIGPVVEKLQLDENSNFNGEAEATNPVARAFGLIGQLRSLLSVETGGEGELDPRAIRARESLYDALTISRGDKTFVISVSARTEDPELSSRIANTVVDTYIETSGRLQSATAGRAEDELSSRLDELRAELTAAEQAVEAFRTRNDLVDAQGRLISDDEIIRLNEQLADAEAQTIELQARAESARGLNLGAVLAGGIPEALASSVLSELRAQYAALRQQADSIANRLGPRHPQRRAIEAQLNGARAQIAQELTRIVASIESELSRSRSQAAGLTSRLDDLKARQSGISGEMVQLRQLEREAAAQRAVYENFLLRAREAGEQKTINTANISIISEATPPIEASGLSRAFITFATMIAGFGLGLAVGALRGIVGSHSERRTDTETTVRDRSRFDARDQTRHIADDPDHPNAANTNGTPTLQPEDDAMRHYTSPENTVMSDDEREIRRRAAAERMMEPAHTDPRGHYDAPRDLRGWSDRPQMMQHQPSGGVAEMQRPDGRAMPQQGYGRPNPYGVMQRAPMPRHHSAPYGQAPRANVANVPPIAPYAASAYGDPRMHDPRFADHRMPDPRMNDPRMHDPRLHGAPADPRYGHDPYAPSHPQAHGSGPAMFGHGMPADPYAQGHQGFDAYGYPYPADPDADRSGWSHAHYADAAYGDADWHGEQAQGRSGVPSQNASAAGEEAEEGDAASDMPETQASEWQEMKEAIREMRDAINELARRRRLW